MEKMLALACLMPLALLASAAADQPGHPVSPLLWKIEAEHLEEPTFLFGIIHLSGGPLANPDHHRMRRF